MTVLFALLLWFFLPFALPRMVHGESTENMPRTFATNAQAPTQNSTSIANQSLTDVRDPGASSRPAAQATVAYWRAVVDIDKRNDAIGDSMSKYLDDLRKRSGRFGPDDQAAGHAVDEWYKYRRQVDGQIDELQSLEAKNVDEDVIKYAAQLQALYKRESQWLEHTAIFFQEFKEYYRKVFGVGAMINTLLRPWDWIDCLWGKQADQMKDKGAAVDREEEALREDSKALEGRRKILAATVAQRYAIEVQ